MKKIGVFLAIIALLLIVIVYLSRQNNIPQRSNIPNNTSTSEVSDISFNLPSGFSIRVFSSDLSAPRDLEFSPGGTLLVTDPSVGLVYALPSKKIVISGENRPHGIAFYNSKLYVADVDQVVRYTWDEANLTATKDRTLFSLPQNNNHNNRTITFDRSGKMYVSVASTCNVCNEASIFSGTVILSDVEGRNPTIFARGLRNTAFISVNPKTNELWGTEMGRDYLGDDLPPDEINIIRQDLDYGWPYCYGNKIHDDNFDPGQTHSCADTQPPIYEIPAHSAPLGFAFINSAQFPADWQGDLLVAYHGSWNRSTPIGYKVVHLKVSGNTITGSEDFLSGFLRQGSSNGPSDALGRPADLIFDKTGNLYLSDDKSGNVYIIQKQ